MKRITLKQSWNLAYGRHVRQARREDAQPETDYPRRLADAESRGNTICWQCEQERPDSINACPHCGANCTPF